MSAAGPPIELAQGFGLVESPRWHDGRLWFADWTAGEILVLGPDGARRCRAARVAAAVLRLPARRRAAGRLRGDAHAAARRARRLVAAVRRPAPAVGLGANDIVVDGRGNAYVNSNDAEFAPRCPPRDRRPDASALVPADGEPRLVADDLAFPNGMAVTADNETLIVAESYRQQLTAFDIAADGALRGRRVFAALGDDPPDGITIDADGAVWYADVPHQQCVRVAEGGTVLDRSNSTAAPSRARSAATADARSTSSARAGPARPP